MMYGVQWAQRKACGITSSGVTNQAACSAQVFIFYSGHGGQVQPDQAPIDETDNKDELIAGYDTTDAPLANYIRDDEFKQQLDSLGTAHVAIIFDSCNSGGLDVSNADRAVLAASQENQLSFETSELEHGVLTYYVLEALQTPASDTNADGWVSMQEIYNYAGSRADSYVFNKTGTHQNPALNLTKDFKVARVP
jgi:uncharacterized caspase-like protein